MVDGTLANAGENRATAGNGETRNKDLRLHWISALSALKKKDTRKNTGKVRKPLSAPSTLSAFTIEGQRR